MNANALSYNLWPIVITFLFFFSGMSLRVTDLAEIDKDYVPGLMCIRDMDETFEAMEMPFSTPSASGQEVQLHNKVKRITLDNREEYVRLALHYRLHEFDVQVSVVLGLGSNYYHVSQFLSQKIG